MYYGDSGGVGGNCHFFSDSRPNCIDALLPLLLTVVVTLLNKVRHWKKKSSMLFQVPFKKFFQFQIKISFQFQRTL